MNTYEWILVVAGTLSFSRFFYLFCRFIVRPLEGDDGLWDNPMAWYGIGCFFTLVFALDINHKETKQADNKPNCGYDCRKIENKEK